VVVAPIAVASLLTFTPASPIAVKSKLTAAQTTGAVSIANNPNNGEVIAGTWSFSPALGATASKAGPLTITATFTPTSANYVKGSVTGTVTVQ
jgi:hypothetical protein